MTLPPDGVGAVDLPLTGVRVADLSRNIAGPLCTMLLGDLGADVIKVEREQGGDEARNHASGQGTSPYFAALNRNKRSVCLNLKEGTGQKALARLLRHCDVLVDNFRPGAMARLGFGDERLARDFPDLVVCHISGFGPTGPWAEAAAYDHIIQGFSGLMSLTGPAGVGGYRTNTSVADVVTGLFAATSVLASLHGRHHLRGGRGGRGGQDIITISLLGGLLNALGYQAATYLSTGVAPQPTGNQHPYIVPYGTFATSDGTINVCVGNDRLFARFCAALGLPDLPDDARFTDNSARVRNRDALNEVIEATLGACPSAHWMTALRQEGVPCGPVHTLAEALSHEQVAALDIVTETGDGLGGRVSSLGPPFRSPRLEGMVRRRPPLLGEHTEEVLAELEQAEQDVTSSPTPVDHRG